MFSTKEKQRCLMYEADSYKEVLDFTKARPGRTFEVYEWFTVLKHEAVA